MPHWPLEPWFLSFTFPGLLPTHGKPSSVLKEGSFRGCLPSCEGSWTDWAACAEGPDESLTQAAGNWQHGAFSFHDL